MFHLHKLLQTYIFRISNPISIPKNANANANANIEQLVLGRWKLEKCSNIINRKIDYSNEDHCGTCGDNLLQNKNNTNM
jgi:hypothetical protein